MVYINYVPYFLTKRTKWFSFCLKEKNSCSVTGIKSQSASPIFHQEALSVEYSICADQFEASYSPWATHRHLTVFCAPGGGEFEPCLGEVGNLNQRNVRVLILDVK